MNRAAMQTVRRWRNSALHRDVDEHRAKWVWKLALGISLSLLPFAVYLLQTMRYVETRYEIERLRTDEARTLEAERRLGIEKARLESLPEVETRAVQDLGLARPRPSHAVVVAPESIGRTSRPPGPAATPLRSR